MTVPLDEQTAREWLATAVEEARTGRAEGGIPIGAALIAAHGAVRGVCERIEATTPDELPDLAVHHVKSGRHGTPVEPGRSADKSSRTVRERKSPDGPDRAICGQLGPIG